MGKKISVLLRDHITRKASCCGVQLEDLQKEYERETHEISRIIIRTNETGEPSEASEPF